MNIKLLQEKADAYFASERFEQYVQELINKDAILGKQLERFHTKWGSNLSEIIDKVVAKYDSDVYVDRWYRRGIEPQEALYSFLLRYAEIYGRELTYEEYEKHTNMFTGDIYIIGDYVVNLMHGQGSCIIINKLTK